MAIAAETLVEQVKQTAGWLFGSDEPWVHTLNKRPQLGTPDYFRLLLTAHFCTVATFVPTDVDARIRFHEWQEMRNANVVRAAMDVVDEVAAYDTRAVSMRYIDTEQGTLSGHDGEWLGVRAGALGRALALGADALVDQLAAQIDHELAREAAIYMALERKGDPIIRLCAATTLAHNVGDLSRVVDTWPSPGQEAAAFQARYIKLGTPAAEPRFGEAFVRAGHVNKALMADENHRFLPLRESRPLRRGREVLLPFGPFLDAWGGALARFPYSAAEHGEILTALLSGHSQAPEQQGYLRAIAGMHANLRGGVDRLESELPARLRKLLRAGAVRPALDLSAERFHARIIGKLTKLG